MFGKKRVCPVSRNFVRRLSIDSSASRALPCEICTLASRPTTANSMSGVPLACISPKRAIRVRRRFDTSSPFSNLLSHIAQSGKPTPSRPKTDSNGFRMVAYIRSSFFDHSQKSLPPFITLGSVLVTENGGTLSCLSIITRKTLLMTSIRPLLPRCGSAISR
ncbi:hypothetical protein SDC9_133684 [bioreactor metagenome]|uniref:Uncharacterized protein n=1 Tax=bioreactor metagenome TaxID=1076179 RepID=A0A645DB74_9ZZZZ